MKSAQPEVVKPTLAVSAVNVERIADCPFSLALENAHVIFAILDSRGGGVRVPLAGLGLPFRGALRRRVETHFYLQRDEEERGRAHYEVVFNWKARSLWLPDFHGVLRFRIEALRTRVILLGEYEPRLGVLGSLYDRVFGCRVACASAVDAVERLALLLENLWLAER